MQKQRVEQKVITTGTLRNYQKTIISFCEATDVLIQWKKVTKGLPRGKRFSDDRAPTIEEIQQYIASKTKIWIEWSCLEQLKKTEEQENREWYMRLAKDHFAYIGVYRDVNRLITTTYS